MGSGRNSNKSQGWKYRHAPISESEQDNGEWWRYRAERDRGELASGDAGVDSSRVLYFLLLYKYIIEIGLLHIGLQLTRLG